MSVAAERPRGSVRPVEGRRATLVNGVRFDAVSRSELLQALDGFLADGGSHIVHFFAGHPTVLARSDAVYREIVNRGDLNIADGASVALAMRMLGAPTGRITGSDAMSAVCDWGIPRGLRHYFYGGTPEVLDRLRSVLLREHPGLEIAGLDAPPFAPVTNAGLDEAAERIREARADVVWVGLGVPKQDLAADGLCGRGAARVIVCVGAAFDFVSGAKPRAPRWMQRLGLEWIYRLASEPRRLWRRYLIGNPEFVAGVFWDYLRGARAR